MSNLEFGDVVSWLEIAFGKPLADSKEARDKRANVYFEMLGKYPVDAFRVAARRIVRERKYQSFPSVAELQEFIIETLHGEIMELTAQEAFNVGMKACGQCDIESYGSVDRAFANIPEKVKRAVWAFGFMALYNLPSSAMETARAQFIKLYEALEERDHRDDLYPQSLKDEIKRIGRNQHAQLLADKMAKRMKDETGS